MTMPLWSIALQRPRRVLRRRARAATRRRVPTAPRDVPGLPVRAPRPDGPWRDREHRTESRAFYCWPYPGVALFADGDDALEYPDKCDEIRCPYGTTGDQLWVKETIVRVRTVSGGWVASFTADGAPTVIDTWPWKRDVLPAIFTPRGASRITLEIGEVRVQRLQEIDEDDARAEGVEPYTPPYGHISPEQRVPGPGSDRCRLGDQPHRLPFADLWDTINGKPRAMLDDDGKPVLDDTDRPIMVASRSWLSNPWVWALTFRRLP